VPDAYREGRAGTALRPPRKSDQGRDVDPVMTTQIVLAIGFAALITVMIAAGLAEWRKRP
jgi:hypothetical protein